MKKKLFRNLSLIMMTILLIFSLFACGGSKDTGGEATDTSNTERDHVIPPSEAFAEEGIWFYSDSPMVTKDEKVDYTLVFDGNGNVTRYTTDFTYADLRDLSDEEILELAKERDKALFESEMQELLSTAENIIHPFRGDPDPDLYNQVVSVIDNAQYQEPTSYPFALKAITDGTGNETINEILSYTYCTWNPWLFDDTGWYPDTWNTYRELDEETELFVSPSKMTVYDMQFNGFGNLFQKVEEEHPGFILDSPDTEGIEVD